MRPPPLPPPPPPPPPLEELEPQKAIPTDITNSDNSSACSSPRISFSDDLHDQAPQIEAASTLLSFSDPSTDFNFCKLEHQFELSPADELFSGGVILPIHKTIRQINANSINSSDNQPAEMNVPDSIKNISEFDQEITTTKATLIREERSESKSFWRFRRSSSFNCHDGNKKSSASSPSSSSSTVWSLPLLLRRSNSTGSTSFSVSPHASGMNSKNGDHNKKQSPKSSSAIKLSSSTPSSSGLQKPPLNLKKKKSYGDHGSSSSNGGSVLNMPPPYIIKGTSDLLGIASFFRNGKHKNSSSNRKP